MAARPRFGHLVFRTLLGMAIAALGLWFVAQWRVDRCVEGGGRWNYETHKCDGAHRS